METASGKKFVERRAHDKFRLLFEHSADAHFIMIDGKITDCNEAAASLLGCSTRDEVLSIGHIAELSPEYQPDGTHSQTKSAEMDALARKKGHHRFEWHHRKKNGTIFPVEVTLNALEINGRPALIAVWHDLTERNRREEELRTAHRKIKDDLKAAAEIQRALLPVKSPLVSGLRTAWTFQPSDEIGGDILNVFAIDDKRIGFYVLDAAGHGVAAALLSVSAAHFLSPFSEASMLKNGDKVLAPSAVAQHLNRHFCSNPEAVQIFTLLYGILNRETLELAYVCAGHLPPVLLTGKKAVYLPGSSGPPLGISSEAKYENTVMTLREADRIYFYSDGLIEARNDTGAFYGAERFLNLAVSQWDEPLSSTTDGMVRAVEKWCGSVKPADDITLLALDIVI